MAELILEKNPPVMSLILNRPEKCNALNKTCIERMLKYLKIGAEDNNCLLLKIRGEGLHFCTGVDIHEWCSANPLATSLLTDLFYELYHFPKPTLALIQGKCLGGGMGLLAACDIAIAADNAQFGFPEIKIGLTPSTISPYVVAAMGKKPAAYYFFTGEYFKASEAKKLGLIQTITAACQLEASGITMQNLLLQHSADALIAMKKLFLMNFPISSELIQNTAEHLTSLRKTASAQEGIQAFLEKRPPNWSKE